MILESRDDPSPDLTQPGIGFDMLLALFTAFAVGLASTVAVVTLVIPFTLGLFGRRDLP